ncbi:8-amino-7-oxononanoate synthase [Ideonella azotifigens]|uniref:8-amino-7-oxononanoate synthase n=2 Tax=Ideonella azotifigens TaxID=513160 RepID=A0ABN1K105_9BURK|nr:8-amino-7-oxononanoate synthase [Ideonella azotifigens]MCD2341636.1 8-amino-7-oxononanoate synthase [Ideonella azotifigens]
MTASWIDELGGRLAELGEASLLRRRRVVVPETGARLTVDGQSMLAFCSNDYLGLAGDPALRAAAHAAIDAYGIGSGASPMVSGHSAANAALEDELAAFVQLPKALYFYAGFATNASIVPALVGPGDAMFSDELNHASLIDGMRLSKARIQRYEHADLGRLEAQLATSTAPRKLVLTDAVFSMDGDVADVPGLQALCEKYDALLLIDDAHGFGVLGPQGRGVLAAAGLTGANASRRVIYMATLSKALGVAGAFVAGDAVVIEWLLQKTRSYTFATAAPALLAEAARAGLREVAQPQGDARRAALQARIAQLRDGLDPTRHPEIAAVGWQLLKSDTAIQPLIIGDNAASLQLMDALREAGLWVPAIRPPTVPAGTARLRIALSAAHTEADVALLVDTLRRLAAASLPG